MFTEEKTRCIIAYLVDIFDTFNQINISLQGKESTIIKLSEKMKSFIMKLELWITKIDQNKLYMFPTLEETLEECTDEIEMHGPIKEHLRSLIVEITHYFPDINDKSFNLTINPFSVNVYDVQESAQEEFIELSNSIVAKTDFVKLSIDEFWVKCQVDFPLLANMAIRNLLPFPTTYLCETAFSQLLIIKNKNRNKLNVEEDLRCALSITSPRINLLSKKLQYQPSH